MRRRIYSPLPIIDMATALPCDQELWKGIEADVEARMDLRFSFVKSVKGMAPIVSGAVGYLEKL